MHSSTGIALGTTIGTQTGREQEIVKSDDRAVKQYLITLYWLNNGMQIPEKHAMIEYYHNCLRRCSFFCAFGEYIILKSGSKRCNRQIPYDKTNVDKKKTIQYSNRKGYCLCDVCFKLGIA